MRSTTTQTLKLLLLDGKSLTVAELDKRLKTNNSAEVVRRLRQSGFPVITTWKTNEKTGARYGEYSHKKTKAVSKIKSQAYRLAS